MKQSKYEGITTWLMLLLILLVGISALELFAFDNVEVSLKFMIIAMVDICVLLCFVVLVKPK